MSTGNSREKVMAVFKKLFRSSEKINDQDAANVSSPSRRFLGRPTRNHRSDAVIPAEVAVAEKSGTSQNVNPFFNLTNKSSSQVFILDYIHK